MTALARAVERLSRVVARATAVICVVVLYVMLALLAAQVVLRYFFGAPPSWTGEVAISLFAWAVLLYATVGVRERFHVAVDFLAPESGSVRRALDRVVMVLVGAFGGLLVYAGWGYVARTAGQTSAALQFPIEALHLSAPVCGLLLILHALALFLRPDTNDGAHE